METCVSRSMWGSLGIVDLIPFTFVAVLVAFAIAHIVRMIKDKSEENRKK